MSNKIKAKLLIEVETDLNDKKSDENTIGYLIEQDLQDEGWQVNKIINGNKEHIKHYIFGIVNSIVYCWNHYNEGSARDLYLNLLSDFEFKYIVDVISEIDCDIVEGFKSFYESEIKK